VKRPKVVKIKFVPSWCSFGSKEEEKQNLIEWALLLFEKLGILLAIFFL
jgi:hypothetical protein